MSMILDALSRSGRERRQAQQSAPDIDTQSPVPGEPTRAGWQRMALWLLPVIALLAAGLWLLRAQQSPVQPAATAAAVQPVGVADQSSPTVAPESPVAASAQAAAAEQRAKDLQRARARLAAEKAAQRRQLQTEARESAKSLYADAARFSSVAVEAPQNSARTPVANPAPAAPATPSETAAAAPEEAPVDIEALVTAARNTLNEKGLMPHPAPMLDTLSQQTRDAIPTLLYAAHDYSSGGAASSVTINGKRLRAGATAAAGVRVEEILSDSVILGFRGAQFRLRALNSWVNL